MARVAFVNGAYRSIDAASIRIEDRGFQFADGVYEVCAVMDGSFLDLDAHLDRLDRSLGALKITWPMARRSLHAVMSETVRRNAVRDGLVYLEITRGAARRDHAFPPADVRPTLVVTVRPMNWSANAERASRGIAVVTEADPRWKHCDIKTVALLPNVLAREAARQAGAGEAWFVDAEGYVTEGAASNAWIVQDGRRLVTRGLDPTVLAGVTRATLIEAAATAGLSVDIRRFTPAEALEAREAFITGAGGLVLPVVSLDGHPIGPGVPGPIAETVRRLYLTCVRRTAVIFSHLQHKLF